MKQSNITRTLTLMLLAGATTFVSCSKEEDDLQVGGKTYTMTVNASKGGEKASKQLDLDGTTLTATWAEGEAITVYNVSKSADLTGTLTAQSSGASTTLKGTLTGTIENGDVLKLKFLTPSYSSQTGTLAYIAANCDYAEATVTVTDASTPSVTTTDASFVNQIVKFTLKNKADDEALSVNKLFVTTGGTSCEVTPSSATSELYVAVPAIASGHVTLTARSGSTYYDYVKTGVTFAQSQYYTINASLTQVKNIDERPAILGRVVAANGKMYASVESATNAGTTALTVIAQVDHYIGFDECMAIAISDESSKMTWGAAYSACENKTPNIEGATWMLPTVEYWQQMFAANGGNSESWTGLNTLFTKAVGTALMGDAPWRTYLDGYERPASRKQMLYAPL
ncbi:MAG: hypothetical protein ACSW8I_00125 [bacterium]